MKFPILLLLSLTNSKYYAGHSIKNSNKITKEAELCEPRVCAGGEMVAYVPGIGHNLQEHNIVLVRVGRLKDCPGVKLKCVRGKCDLPQVIKQKVQ
ncbi:hypothetical protein PYW07_011964 [Mythimna separata]|uniref:Small ribosomal subunit protein uS12m n=1 Tax=Mythimna separata TaxID=271217 RepID=A0AAD7YKS2_MYTSE|nr:hypothetical protein PYW07_011964 [Mythimna separata]